MDQGKVKWFSNKKGFGFIERAEGDDLFVHFTDIKMDGYRSLAQGDTVEFSVESSERGPVAKNVVVIGASNQEVQQAANG